MGSLCTSTTPGPREMLFMMLRTGLSPVNTPRTCLSTLSCLKSATRNHSYWWQFANQSFRGETNLGKFHHLFTITLNTVSSIFFSPIKTDPWGGSFNRLKIYTVKQVLSKRRIKHDEGKVRNAEKKWVHWSITFHKLNDYLNKYFWACVSADSFKHWD